MSPRVARSFRGVKNQKMLGLLSAQLALVLLPFSQHAAANTEVRLDCPQECVNVAGTFTITVLHLIKFVHGLLDVPALSGLAIFLRDLINPTG